MLSFLCWMSPTRLDLWNFKTYGVFQSSLSISPFALNESLNYTTETCTSSIIAGNGHKKFYRTSLRREENSWNQQYKYLFLKQRGWTPGIDNLPQPDNWGMQASSLCILPSAPARLVFCSRLFISPPYLLYPGDSICAHNANYDQHSNNSRI